MTRFIKSVGIFVITSVCWMASTAKTSAFPIATDSAVIEFGGKVTVVGTNYLAGLVIGTNVAGQLLTMDGQLIGSPVVIGANPGFPPAVAMASAKTNCLAAWTDYSISTGVTLFGRIISSAGVGSSFPLLSLVGSHGVQAIQAAASDGTNFLVVWRDNSNRSHYGQLVSGNGAPAGSEFLIFTMAGEGDRNVALAFGQTNYLIAWQDGTDHGDQTYGRLISPSGAVGSVFQINATSSSDMNPITIGFDGTNYLAVWSRATNYSSGGWPEWQLCARRVSPSGVTLGSELTLVTEQAAFPAIAFDGDNYLLAWGFDTSTTNNDQSVHAQFFDRFGNALGPICTPFTAKGNNPPLLPLDGVLFAGQKFLLSVTFGSFMLNDTGDVVGFAGGDVYGKFVPRSTTPPIFTNGIVANGHFQGQLEVVPGMTYTIELSTNLQDWTPVNAVSSDKTNRLDLLDEQLVSGKSRLFYRAAVGNFMPASFDFNFHHFANAGSFGSSFTPTVSFPVALNSYSANFGVENDQALPAATNIYFTGPSGSGLSQTPADAATSYIGTDNAEYQSPFVSIPATAPGGNWTVNYKGTNYAFNAADPQAASRLVIPLPTASVIGGTLQSVSWNYKDASTGAVLGNAPAYMTWLQVQIEGFVGGRIYDSPEIAPSLTSHALTSSVAWTNVCAIHMAYDDSLGNHYVVTFAKP